jgi:flagellar protein FlaG
MTSNISPASPVGDSNLDRSPAKEKGGPTQQSRPKAESAPAKPESKSTDLRLVIEKDEAGILFVYRLIDPVTGNVVVEIPRNDLKKLGEGPNYTAGSVVSTRA